MPDVLTHVLWGYIIGMLLSFRYERIDKRFVTIVMLGALLPDLTKISLVIDDAVVEHALGIPFSWGAIHRLGGVIIACAVGALLAGNDYRKLVFGLLSIGAASHLILDGLLINASGYSYDMLWPLATYHFPTPNLFLSSDRWPAILSAAIAAGVWLVNRRVASGTEERGIPSSQP